MSSSAVCSASDPAQLKSAREDIRELLKTTFCHPILVWFSFVESICSILLFFFFNNRMIGVVECIGALDLESVT